MKRRCQVWAVLNVTPDSFSDGGETFEHAAAFERAKQLLAAGADVIDVGGVSSRPPGATYGAGATPVGLEEELRRVIPVVEQLVHELGARVSVDTSRVEVAREALRAGASIINDVTNGTSEELLELVAASPAELLLMHNRGDGRAFGENADYRNVVEDVMAELSAAAVRACAYGMARDRIWVDPGIGFAKTAADSIAVVAALPQFLRLGYRVLVGPSRKSFIAVIEANENLTQSAPNERLGGTAAAVAFSVQAGVDAVRVHDVAVMRQTVLVTEALCRAQERGARGAPFVSELTLRLSHFFDRDLTAILWDFADVFLVATILYFALLLLKGTRAMQMGVGIVVVFAVYQSAKRLGLVTLFTMLDTLLTSLVLIVVVIFQQDIRRAITRFGRSPFFSSGGVAMDQQVIDDAVRAATSLAQKRIGALVAFERESLLEEFIEAGTTLDATVSKELLYSLFIPSHENPLHDGAVIIREGRIWQAGAFLPLTASTKLDRNLGTRHRAAIGISEETDAVVIVVSEERGEVSLCFNGNIVRNLDSALLRKVLLGLFQKRQKRRTGGGGREERGGKERHARASTNPGPPDQAKTESNPEAS